MARREEREQVQMPLKKADQFQPDITAGDHTCFFIAAADATAR